MVAKIRDLQWRLALIYGLLACVLMWADFLVTGGAAGDKGEFAPALAFLVGALGSGLAGYVASLRGADLSVATLTGLGTGVVEALFYGFPHSALLLVNRAYVHWLETLPRAKVGRYGINVGYLHRLSQLGSGGPPALPSWELRLLAALTGALLAGAFLGAATGSIGSSFSRRTTS
jgi:hypothetical protein